MRCLYGTHDKAPIIRFCPLSVQVGVTGFPTLNADHKRLSAEFSQDRRGGFVMARVVEFYITTSFRRKVTPVRQSQPEK